MTEDARPVNANCASNADSAATPDKSQASVALQSARDSPSQTSPRSESQGTTQYEYKSSSSSASAFSKMHDNTHRVLQQKAGVTSADLRSAGPAAATSIPSFSPPYLKPVLNHVMSPDAMLVRQPVLESEIAKRVEDDQRRLQMSLPVASISAAPAVLAPAPIPMPLCAPPSPRSSSRSRQETKKRLFFEEVSAGLDRFCNTPVSVPATSAAPQVGPDPRNPLSPQPNPSSQSRRQSVAHAAAGGGDDGELHVDEPAPPRSKVFSPQIRPPPPLGQRSSSPSHTSQPECCHFTPERYHSSQSVTTQSQNVAATPPPRHNRADFSPAASLTSPAAPHGLIPDEPTSGEALPPNEEARRYVTMMEARRYVTKLVCVADLCVAFLT